MKLTSFLIFVALVQATASVYSQTTLLSLNMKNSSLKEVFREIEKQSEFTFLYNDAKINVNKEVNVDFQSGKVEDILNQVLNGTGIAFVVIDKQVVLAGKDQLSSAVQAAQQQVRKITGKITDQGGASLPGVSVVVKGTTAGVITDSDGNYSLSGIPANATLQFSFVGMKMQEIEVGNKTTVNVVLAEETIGLEEVIAVGYTSKQKSQISSSISVIPSEKLKTVTSNNVSNMLQGQAAGVVVSSSSGDPNAGTAIIIRGSSSINADSSPLYVVDGIIGGTANPRDVESITILKDAAATGLYGSRAANGVIIITTKSGKSGKTRVNINNTVGFSYASMGNYQVMNSQQAYDYQKSFLSESFFNQYRPASLLDHDTKWMDLAYRTGFTQSYGADLSGGNEKTQFYIAGNYYDEQGTVYHTNRKEYNFRANLTHRITDKLKVIVKLNVNSLGSENEASGNYGAIHGAASNMPWDYPCNDDGSIRKGTEAGWIGRENDNFLHGWQYNSDFTNGKGFDGDLNFDYNIFKNLTFSTYNRVSFRTRKREMYYDVLAKAGKGMGELWNWFNNDNKLITSNRLKYDKNFGKNSVTAIAVFEGEKNFSDNNNMYGNSIATGLHVMEAAAMIMKADGISPGNIGENAFYKGLVQVDYSFNHKYFLIGSLINEASSRFGVNNRSANFFTLGSSWILSNEDFMDNLSIFNELKIRASYGSTGNANIGNYQSMGLYSFSTQYNGVPGAIPSQLANPDLTWEKANTTDFGIDIGLFNRITFNFDWYDKTTDGLLLSVEKPYTSGYTSFMANVGSIKNRGVEFVLNTKNLVGEFKWETGFNISFNKNEILKLAGGKDITSGNFRFREGEGLYTYWFQKWAGVDPANGDPLWEVVTKDANGVATISTTNAYASATMQLAGSALPDFTGGLTNNFSYKRFYLNTFANFTHGNLVYNSMDSDGAYETLNERVLTSGESIWKTPGDIATHPKPVLGGNHNSNKPSSRFLEDGSYFRLRNVTFGYNLPTKLLSALRISTASIYFSADNAFTLTKFKGTDPEVFVSPGAGTVGDAGGNYKYPMSKKMLFGINIGF